MEVTMNRSGNNFTLTPRDYGAYASDSYGRNSQTRLNVPQTRLNIPQFVVPSLAPSDANWPAPPPWAWWILEDRLVRRSSLLPSCAICLKHFEPIEMVTMTPCNHMFHEECIVPWLKSHGQCPVCRFALCERSLRSAVPSNNNMADEANDLIYF